MSQVPLPPLPIACASLLACCTGPGQASLKPAPPRTVINLNGSWQVEQGDGATPPETYRHRVPVPGLLDMAQPRFADVGKKSPRRAVFWYRRTFKLEGKIQEIPEVAILKIHKAKYGTRVWLNGQLVGEHLPCFTPGYFDVKTALRGGGQENEVVIRVGADRDSMPQDMPTGWDFEKYLYIPGIYDSMELILTGKPYIRHVQVVPGVPAKRVRVVAEIDCGGKSAGSSAGTAVTGEVTPAGISQVVGRAKATVSPKSGEPARVELNIPIRGCRLWSPEDPFLYNLTLSTGADAVRVRFGVRSFRFDPQTKRALLNGKPYYLRGSNVTMYRFFEDAERADLPWRPDWVRRLHRQFKSMHWNSLRYCIGFPPELWYEIADEEGVLIQDEFPIWLLGGQRSNCPEWPVAEKIIPQYTAWMRERWNHPCVMIWDGQNESITPETGKAIQAVRHLDLSNRPWENGWAEPQSPNDCVESHPYLFIRDHFRGKPFRMSELATHSGTPNLNAAQRKLGVSTIINEYGWLWLTRDGNPTCVTQKVYQHLLGPTSTVEERRRIYARYLAALTEFWRAHRRCAGVLHFCGLGYSRPGDKPRPEGGATSDHWLDVKRLEFEPHFAEYVRDAFNPVGVMLDFWAEELPAGSSQRFKVYVTNDLDKTWRGDVRLSLVHKQECKSLATQTVEVAPLAQEVVHFTAALPGEPGQYTLQAELDDGDGQTVRSLRDVNLK